MTCNALFIVEIYAIEAEIRFCEYVSLNMRSSNYAVFDRDQSWPQTCWCALVMTWDMKYNGHRIVAICAIETEIHSFEYFNLNMQNYNYAWYVKDQRWYSSSSQLKCAVFGSQWGVYLAPNRRQICNCSDDTFYLIFNNGPITIQIVLSWLKHIAVSVKPFYFKLHSTVLNPDQTVSSSRKSKQSN